MLNLKEQRSLRLEYGSGIRGFSCENPALIEQ